MTFSIFMQKQDCRPHLMVRSKYRMIKYLLSFISLTLFFLADSCYLRLRLVEIVLFNKLAVFLHKMSIFYLIKQTINEAPEAWSKNTTK